MITRRSIIILTLFTFVQCGQKGLSNSGNKKSQALEQEVLTLRENLTALWEVVGQIRSQLERLESEEVRVHHHHHHYHHRYYVVANNASLDDLNGTTEEELSSGQNSACQHEMAFEQLSVPTNGIHHKHHHHIHHHHPKDANYTEQNGLGKCNGNHNGLNANGGPDEDDSEEILAKAFCPMRPNRALPIPERQNVRGTVHFRQKANHLTVYMNLRGFLIAQKTDLQPNHDELVSTVTNTHSLHVHEFGDLSNGCESAGEHYNPYKREDDHKDNNKKHVGDFGNIHYDDEGKLEMKIVDSSASLLGAYSIIGKTLVIHENPDDEGTNSENGSNGNHPVINGNHGRRLACCVIAKQAD